MTKTKTEKINIRKYVNWVLLMVAVVLVCLIGSKLYSTYKTNQLKESVLTRVVGTIQLDDWNNAKNELASSDFIFISYVKSEDVRNLELKLKDKIVDYELQNNFYYLDATDMMLEENYIDDLNEKFGLKDNNKIEALPALLYYKDGTFIKTVTSTKDAMMRIDDFDKLLDNYEIIDFK